MALPGVPHPRAIRTLIGIGLAVLLVPTGLVAPAVAQAKVPPPPARFTAPTIDAHLGYKPQKTCSPSAKPGATALLKTLIATWGGSSSGISRSCSSKKRSEHKEGRALDWHMSVRNASERKRVAKALKWITANHGEVARRLGIMYVLWNQRIWSVYYPDLGWRDMEDRGSFTANHKDHVHISLSWDGAYKQTSWWTGVPVTVPLNSACGVAGARRCLPTVARSTRHWPFQKTYVPAIFSPAPQAIPGIGGSPQVGRRLRAVPGTWVPSGATLTYQWVADRVAIPGATGASFVIQPAQVNKRVEVKVSATLGSWHQTKMSAYNNQTYPARLSSAPRPRIAGSFVVGKTVQARPGTWRPAPITLRYIWLRDGKPIKGATGIAYRLKSRDRGHRIAVKVRGSRYGYYRQFRTSASHKVRR